MVLVKDVGHRLPALRKERGLTQADLAELIGHSEVSVRSIEPGASAPSFETLGRPTRALDVTAVRSSPPEDNLVTTGRIARALAILEASHTTDTQRTSPGSSSRFTPPLGVDTVRRRSPPR